MQTKPIYAFIDSQNLNLSVKNDLRDINGNIYYHGWRLDFKKLFIYLKTKYKVTNAFLFIGKVPGNQSLYNSLTAIGYSLIFKPTLNYSNNKNQPQIKGNVDAELVLHAMIEFYNYDKAIIIAGDGDYLCLINYLEAKNKLLHVMIPNKYKYSRLLKPYIKYFVFVTDLEANLK